MKRKPIVTQHVTKSVTTFIGNLAKLAQRLAPLANSRFAVGFLCGAIVVSGVLTLGGCLSVNIGGGKMKKSEGVKLSAPSAPFQDAKNENADRAWINKKNGNSISYLTVCNDPADPTIEAATQDLFSDLSDTKTLKSEHFTFNHRDALRTEVQGEIDGVPTQISAVVFKRNDCLYTINYVGVVKAYPDDRGRFETFLTSFEAP